ncbi:MAG: hypothetical protein PQ975_04040 [Methanobacterium sp.]|jgi:hypothetical protein
MNKILTIFLGLVLVASFSVGSSVVETPDAPTTDGATTDGAAADTTTSDATGTDNQNSGNNPDGASNTEIIIGEGISNQDQGQTQGQGQATYVNASSNNNNTNIAANTNTNSAIATNNNTNVNIIKVGSPENNIAIMIVSKIKQTTGDNNAQNSQTNKQNFQAPCPHPGPGPCPHIHPHQPNMVAAAGEPIHKVTLPEEGDPADPVGMQEAGLNIGSLIVGLVGILGGLVASRFGS